MTDTIAPALTPEEWNRRAALRDGTEIEAVEGGNLGLNAFDEAILIGAEEFPAVLALANASLPDDSPYKITREDVELVRDSVNELFVQDRVGPGLRALAAKLAALLPPE